MLSYCVCRLTVVPVVDMVGDGQLDIIDVEIWVTVTMEVNVAVAVPVEVPAGGVDVTKRKNQLIIQQAREVLDLPVPVL